MSDPLDELPAEAFALQPVRADEKNDRFVYYEAITFPDNPRGGCWMYLRRAALSGGLNRHDTPYTIDVLDKDGDVIKEYSVTQEAFEYLRRTLRFRVLREEQ